MQPKKDRIAIVVLGDLGRSPRMLYHASSLSHAGFRVDLVGYLDSDLPMDLLHSSNVSIHPIRPFPPHPPHIALYPLWMPMKAMFQFFVLCWTLLWTLPTMTYILVQNPPSVPTLIVAHYAARLRSAKLLIDWHNLGHTILALRFGQSHWLVWMYNRIEMSFGRDAYAHIFVSHAMLNELSLDWNLTGEKIVLYDRPPTHFKSLTGNEKIKFIKSMTSQFPALRDYESKRGTLIVSSTSWTADEDFSILLNALVKLDSKLQNNKHGLSKMQTVFVVITGKGPLRAHYESHIGALDLAHIRIMTGWLLAEHYPLLLGSADLGVCLHTSSSKLDLPMKVVDMFGCSLPVCAYEYSCISELVKPTFGRTFKTADELTTILDTLLSDPDVLNQMRVDIKTYFDCHRWDSEWELHVSNLFGLKKKD